MVQPDRAAAVFLWQREGGSVNPLPAGQFGLIYVDPPWSYEMYSDKGYEKSPDKHYGCMSMGELKAMRDEVLFATAPNAVCVMWGTFALLPEALDLMATWGFQYKTGGPWNKLTKTGKPAIGTGYVLRSSAELFLIGTVGRPRIKNRGQRNVLFTGDVVDDLRELSMGISSVRREHSRKPDEMPSALEALFDGPYLEMFARTERPGWTVWGNQTDKFQA